MAQGLSATQRTLRALRERGLLCAIVEKWNQYAGKFGVRQDLFGFIDILALHPEKGFIAIQSCGQSFSAHIEKIMNSECTENVIDWLKTGLCGCQNSLSHIEVWGWRKVKLKRGGKAMRWKPRVAVITWNGTQLKCEEIKDEGKTTSQQ